MKLEYDEISPITGNKCVIVEGDETKGSVSYMCMESGYTTASHLKVGSTYVDEYESNITDLMRDAKFEEEGTGLVWYPAFIQTPIAILYCSGDSVDQMHWEVSSVVTIDGEERKKFPVPGKDGEYFTTRLDVENAKIYSKEDFETALDEFYSLLKEGYGHED